MSTMQYHVPSESKGQLPSLQENAKWFLSCDKYHAPKLQMLAKKCSFLTSNSGKMQFLIPSKCCASDFLSLKPQSLLGFCLTSANQWKKMHKDLSGARWQR